ncbi:uncharacterized protein FFUJ_06858 [Fusarium fujikuroi IMI 58289]|uniref:Uncharacterized protein n=1 Tax=Gibberella fujikuroi (strain CBS 195.34 / IMI 58289 / NRRL A-6831) TaxID=1279085 RepID=S0E0E6_GIBF5|nr:uncharacterized protein FFUJ_06858 [Fusarium fujikuroi IMI 58289]KLP02526.1 uncharacterized protein LW94_8139 [Fusarium fujikuroi]CCT68095.1 uncharacterized protein FFUJ_06858 [Fusarium fujikuroi IMI 58289]
MSRISPLFRQRLILAARVAAGVSITGAASFHLVTRKCYFEPFGPENGRSLYEHPLLKKINPWNKPGSADSCVREVPFNNLDKVMLEDAKKGGTKLVERFMAGTWGGFGYGIQRRIMTFFKNEANKNDLWDKKDLLASTYEPGTYFTNHFVVLSKTPTCITLRGCFDPHQSPPSPMDVDNLVEIRAELDEMRQVAVLKLQVITFDGRKEASDKEDLFGGVGGWLHRRYSTLLVESGARNLHDGPEAEHHNYVQYPVIPLIATAPTNGRFNSNWHSSITSTGAAISGGILAAFLLATLLSATAEVANGALSGKLGRADFGSELESLAVGEAVAVFPGGSEVRKTLGSADGGASSGKGDEEEESGGELHYEKLRC